MSKRADTGQEWSDKYKYWFECLGEKGETTEGNFEKLNVFVLQNVELRPASFIKGALEKVAVLKE